jgi:prepilin-type N-terminal cleavage/methylation domain-containing protein
MKKILSKNKKYGFTLVEILIAVFIFTIIGIAVVKFQIDIFSLNKLTSTNLVAQQNARQTLKDFTAEVRSMSPSNAGAYYIDQASTSSLTFYTNIDNDSDTEKVRYFLSGTTFKKGVIHPIGNTYSQGNEVVKESVHGIANGTTSIFSYYDNSYDGTSTPLNQPINISSIRLIKINLLIDEDTLKSPGPLYMTTQVSIRNLKDNL